MNEPYYLKCKKVDTAIKRTKTLLLKRFIENGLYENFGQNEVRKIKDKFIHISKYDDKTNENRRKLQEFNNWCMTYNGV
jgi:hypothetical protein